jgi:hypothetical protein
MSHSIYATCFLLLCSLPVGAARQNSSFAPNLIAPEIGAVLDNGCCINRENDGASWKFEWESVPQATRYHLYVIGRTAKNPVIDRSDITATSFLKQGRGDYIVDRYYKGWRWKVRAMVAGTWREWSPERTFDVEPLNTDCPPYAGGLEQTMELSAPVQISPLDGTVYSHYPRRTILQWEEMPGAASYTVEVDCFHCCRNGAWCTDVGGRSRVIPNIKTTSYSFNFAGKQPGRWRVWAVTADRKEGPKSEWMQFTYTR